MKSTNHVYHFVDKKVPIVESLEGKNRTRRFQSTVVLCLERKSPLIIVVIINFLQNRKPHIHCCCKKVSLLPSILATKRERKTDLNLLCWKSIGLIRCKNNERKWTRVTKIEEPVYTGSCL